MSSNRRSALALAALLVVWGAGVAPAQASDDAWITTKIRIALMTTDGAGRNAVKVDTEHGKVRLHGTRRRRRGGEVGERGFSDPAHARQGHSPAPALRCASAAE